MTALGRTVRTIKLHTCTRIPGWIPIRDADCPFDTLAGRGFATPRVTTAPIFIGLMISSEPRCVYLCVCMCVCVHATLGGGETARKFLRAELPRDGIRSADRGPAIRTRFTKATSVDIEKESAHSKRVTHAGCPVGKRQFAVFRTVAELKFVALLRRAETASANDV